MKKKLIITGDGTDDFFYQFQTRLNDYFSNLIKNCDKEDFFIINLLLSFSYRAVFEFLVQNLIDNTYRSPKRGFHKLSINNVNFFIDLTKIQIIKQSEHMELKKNFHRGSFLFRWKTIDNRQKRDFNEIGVLYEVGCSKKFPELKIKKEKFYNITTKILTLIKKAFINATFFCGKNSISIINIRAYTNHKATFAIECSNIDLFKILANKNENKVTEIEEVLFLFADFVCTTEEKLTLNIDQREQVEKIILDFNKLKEELLLLTKSRV